MSKYTWFNVVFQKKTYDNKAQWKRNVGNKSVVMRDGPDRTFFFSKTWHEKLDKYLGSLAFKVRTNEIR